MKNYIGLWIVLICFCPAMLVGQVDSTATDDDWEDIDWDMFDEVEYADEGTKRYCSSKILGISPQQFISLGYDWQGPYQARFSPIGSYAEDETVEQSDDRVNSTHGLRFMANIPVLSRNDLVIQLGANFWNLNYQFDDPDNLTDPLAQSLNERGLRTMGLNTTIFKPLNDKSFILFQGSADLSGNYTLSDFQSLRYLRYSAAGIYGWRSSDYVQWGLGLARTYRVGEMNYIPVALFNWTSRKEKWGAEVLFPARGHLRYNFSPRSMAFFGYELEGQSYRIQELSDSDASLELRRGEMRWRVMYQKQLTGFIWISAQAGYRINWSMNADRLENDGQEFFRGFFGDQTYSMLNEFTNPLYANFSINLVSP